MNSDSTKTTGREELKQMQVEGDRFNFITAHPRVFQAEKGLNTELIHQISDIKKEPEWMREHRLRAYDVFQKKPLPTWGPDLSQLNFDEMTYYTRPGEKPARNWDEVPKEIRETFERIGIPEAERKMLAGSVAVMESESVYHNLRKEWEDKGVIFMDMDTAVREHEDLIKEYFMKCVPATDNKFSALHGAVWSGGSFLYVPENVKVDMPLQTYFRMNTENEGQFEHTLIVAEPNSKVHYIEGCTAPKFSTASLHSAVVEIYVKENAKTRYTTVQNWSKNVYNLNTKRALVHKNAQMEWVGGSLGSYITMLYPCSVLLGENARADHLNIAFGTSQTEKDGGAKVIHSAPNTTSTVVAKSIAMGGGKSNYRGLLRINKGATNAKSHVRCDALILDDISKSDALPHNEIHEPTASFAHEASVNKISDEQLFYLMNRGLSEQEAMSMIVLGFLNEISKEIPLEFAIEFSRLVSLEMERLGSVG